MEHLPLFTLFWTSRQISQLRSHGYNYRDISDLPYEVGVKRGELLASMFM